MTENETKATQIEQNPRELIAVHILDIWRDQDPVINDNIVSEIVERNIEEKNEACPIRTMEEILENHDDGSLQDVIYSFRTDGGEATNIQQFDRNYEIEVRAIKLQGQWVGWWHLHGGGKHSEPEAWPWIENAVFIDLVSEEEVTITKRTFEYKKDE